jgi:hypothetical protein
MYTIVATADGIILNREEFPPEILSKIQAPEYKVKVDENGDVQNAKDVPAGLIELLRNQAGGGNKIRSCEHQL